mmetsp:Transcript_81291/g.238791  ORF Transcript_81291/g.238791 Transcript_81291/m.238791 type:complete len:240 (+) Transcript_81291:79-798(+)
MGQTALINPFHPRRVSCKSTQADRSLAHLHVLDKARLLLATQAARSLPRSAGSEPRGTARPPGARSALGSSASRGSSNTTASKTRPRSARWSTVECGLPGMMAPAATAPTAELKRCACVGSSMMHVTVGATPLHFPDSKASARYESLHSTRGTPLPFCDSVRARDDHASPTSGFFSSPFAAAASALLGAGAAGRQSWARPARHPQRALPATLALAATSCCTCPAQSESACSRLAHAFEA